MLRLPADLGPGEVAAAIAQILPRADNDPKNSHASWTVFAYFWLREWGELIERATSNGPDIGRRHQVKLGISPWEAKPLPTEPVVF
jgi:hypothetical protein